jgi:uncharacterized protein (DUF1499 family)
MSLKKFWLLFLCFATSGRAGCAGERPTNLGVVKGRLAPCPSTPNCVSTQADDDLHRMESIFYTGSREDAQAQIRSILLEMEHVEIIADEPDYMHAEARSRIFGFVDDVEFFFDDLNKQIHFRSAARLGSGDHSVNRNRMQSVVNAFLQKNPQPTNRY